MGLFSAAQKDSQVGVDFLPGGVAVTQVQTGRKTPGRILRSEFVAADGQEAQVKITDNIPNLLLERIMGTIKYIEKAQKKLEASTNKMKVFVEIRKYLKKLDA